MSLELRVVSCEWKCEDSRKRQVIVGRYCVCLVVNTRSGILNFSKPLEFLEKIYRTWLFTSCLPRDKTGQAGEA
jgi:hypothetical protein